MAKSLDDFTLPQLLISSIVKNALPDDVSMSSEAKEVLSKAASVFVLYSTSCANNFAMTENRKMLAASDVYMAMEDMEFKSFVKPLKESLKSYHSDKCKKETAKTEKKETMKKVTETK